MAGSIDLRQAFDKAPRGLAGWKPDQGARLLAGDHAVAVGVGRVEGLGEHSLNEGGLAEAPVGGPEDIEEGGDRVHVRFGNGQGQHLGEIDPPIRVAIEARQRRGAGAGNVDPVDGGDDLRKGQPAAQARGELAELDPTVAVEVEREQASDVRRPVRGGLPPAVGEGVGRVEDTVAVRVEPREHRTGARQEGVTGEPGRDAHPNEGRDAVPGVDRGGGEGEEGQGRGKKANRAHARTIAFPAGPIDPGENMAGQDLSRLARDGASIALQIAWGDRPLVTAVFDAGRIVEQMELSEARHGLVPQDRDNPGSHGHMHRLGLGLIMENADPHKQDWVPVAAAALLWSGLHHPGLGARNVARAATLIAEKGFATMSFEIRGGGLWFEMFDIPPPAGATPIALPPSAEPDAEPGP